MENEDPDRDPRLLRASFREIPFGRQAGGLWSRRHTTVVRLQRSAGSNPMVPRRGSSRRLINLLSYNDLRIYLRETARGPDIVVLQFTQ